MNQVADAAERTDPHSGLAVVICTYNRASSLMETLTSLYSDGYSGPLPIDILVVANNCSDDTLEQLQRFRKAHAQELLRLDWIEEPAPGKSHALNAAITKTGHPVLGFIDDDQVVEPGFLASLIGGITTYPDDDIFCGRIWPAWDGTEPAWVHAREPHAIPIRPFPEYDLGHASIPIAAGNRLPSGGNITVRRRVFAKIGLFSVALGPKGHNLAGGEDHDFLHRAVHGGARVRYLAGMRQLHAVDPARTGTVYTLHKSYLRTRDNFVVSPPVNALRLYMARKVITHFFSALMTFDANLRFFYLVRLAASLGEVAGALRVARETRRQRIPLASNAWMVGGVAVSATLLAIVASLGANAATWRATVPGITIAAAGSLLLLIKSVLDFSQTGPRIRDEILLYYRRYTLFALMRLFAWTFAIMLFTAGAGMLFYYALGVALRLPWSPLSAGAFALLGIGVATGLQFLGKLRYNPGLLVVSMHYRTSRLYALWRWATPVRIGLLRAGFMLIIVAVLLAASIQLAMQNAHQNLLTLWAATLASVMTVIWAGWRPEPRPTKRDPGCGADKRPNIVMIGSDTLRADRLGAAGYSRALTPNIDALAMNSTLFTNCYVPCARTAPSLVSLLTGTWPHTHGIRDNFVADNDTRIELPALPRLLRKLGYRCAALSDWCGADLGKFSLGFELKELPNDQWNIKYLIRQGPKDLRLFLSLFTHNRLGRMFLPEIYYLGGAPLTSQLSTRARSLVSRLADSGQPFFLNVFFSTTHPPFASEWPWYNRFSDPGYKGESKFAMARLTDPFEIIRRQGMPKEEFDINHVIDLYDGCVAQFDAEAGALLRHLEASGLADNTIVVLYSDHGMEFFEHSTWGQGNSAVGEASPRIPLMFHDPRQKGKGVVPNVVRSIDVAPTLLQLAGITPPAQMEGVSLADFINGTADCPELDAFNETGIWIADIPGLPASHLRYPDLMELLEVPNRQTGTLAIKNEYQPVIVRAKDRMIRCGRWKLVYQPLTDGMLLRLFDLTTDPGCQDDISLREPAVVDALWHRLSSWIRQDPMSNLHGEPATPSTSKAGGIC